MYLISKKSKSRVTNLLTFQRNSSFHLPHFEKNDSFICFMSKDSVPWFTAFERTLSSYFKKSLGPMYLILEKASFHWFPVQDLHSLISKKSFFDLPHLPHFKQSHYFIYFRGDFEEIRTSVYLISKKLLLPITSSHRTWDVELDSFIGLTESCQRTLFHHFKKKSLHPEVPRFQKNHVSICLILRVRAFNYSSSPYFRRTRHSEVPHFKELHSFIAKKKDFQISQKFMNSIYLSSKNCIPSKQKGTLR